MSEKKSFLTTVDVFLTKSRMVVHIKEVVKMIVIFLVYLYVINPIK